MPAEQVIVRAQKSFGLVETATASPEQRSIFERWKLIPGSYDIVFDTNGVPCDFRNVKIRGYASTFYKDVAGDQYFYESFPEDVRNAFMRHPVLCMDHIREEVGKVIGKITSQGLDDIGWWIEADVDNSPVDWMKDLRAKIVSGTLTSFSLSGLVIRQKGIQIFTRIDEVSVVWVGCNQQAVFQVKSLPGDLGKASEKLGSSESGKEGHDAETPAIKSVPGLVLPFGFMPSASYGNGESQMTPEQIFAQKSLILNLKGQQTTATEDKVKKDLGKLIQQAESLLEEMEDAVMSGKEAAKKEEAKKEEARKEEAKKSEESSKEEARKEEARKEEAKKEEARKEEAKKAKESEECKEEAKKKALAAGFATVEEFEEALNAHAKKVAKSMGFGDTEPSKIFMPNVIHGMSLQAKRAGKGSRELVHRVEKSLKEKTNLTEDMEFDVSPENIARIMSVSQNPIVRKALALDNDPSRNRVSHAQANIIIAKALEGSLKEQDCSQPISIHKALDGSAGNGDDLVPQELSNILFIRLFGTSQVAPLLTPYPMENATLKVGKVLSPANVGGTPTNVGAVAESSFSTDGNSDVMTAYPFEGYSYVYDDVQMDSVFNLITTLQQIHAIFLGRQLDNAIINGNLAANIDNSYCLIPDSTWATTASRTSAGVYVPVTSFWNGLRQIALNTTGLNTDINSAFASSPTGGIDTVLAKMKRYATQQQAKNVAIVMGPGAIGKTRGDAVFKNLYAGGVLWSLLDGILDTYMGSKVVESYDLSEQLASDGNYNPATTSSHSLASVLAFNRTQYALGIRKTQVFEILRDPTYRRSNVRSVARFGFASLEPTPSATLPTVSVGYNVTV